MIYEKRQLAGIVYNIAADLDNIKGFHGESIIVNGKL
jgi:hypothetical protein